MQVARNYLISLIAFSGNILCAQCIEGSYGLEAEDSHFSSIITFDHCNRFRKTEVHSFTHGAEYSGGYFLMSGDTLRLIYDSIKTPYPASSYAIISKSTTAIDEDQVSIKAKVYDQNKASLPYAYFKLIGIDDKVLYQDLADSVGRFSAMTNSYLVKGLDIGFTGHQPVFIDINRWRETSVTVDVTLSAIDNDRYFHARKIEAWLIESHSDEKIVCFDFSNASQKIWRRIEN